MILEGERRVKEVEPKYKPLVCSKCKGDDHPEDMYFCDGCEDTVVHINCEEKLKGIPDD